MTHGSKSECVPYHQSIQRTTTQIVCGNLHLWFAAHCSVVPELNEHFFQIGDLLVVHMKQLPCARTRNQSIILLLPLELVQDCPATCRTTLPAVRPGQGIISATKHWIPQNYQRFHHGQQLRNPCTRVADRQWYQRENAATDGRSGC